MLSHQGNPTVAHEQREFENPGGRPPEEMPAIDKTSVRERQASPSPLDSDRSSKKGRSEVPGVMHDSDSDMDAEGGLLPISGVDLLQKTGPRTADTVLLDPADQGKESYVSKLLGAQKNGGIGGSSKSFTDAEITILDDDVLMDSKGSSGIVSGGAADSASLDKEKPVESISDANLFGPWMVVDNRRRRSDMAQNLVGNGNGGISGSRFEVLHNVDENNDGTIIPEGGIADNLRSPASLLASTSGVAASMIQVVEGEGNVSSVVSNPVGKAKNRKSGFQTPAVVPLVDGHAVQVTERTSGSTLGQHRAVRISEQGGHGSSGLGLVGARGWNGRGKDVLELGRRGGRISKKSGSIVTTKMSPLELVKHLSDDIARAGQLGHGSINPISKEPDGTSVLIPSSDEDDETGLGGYHSDMDMGDNTPEERGRDGF
ncbi:hypothetical protein V6N13_054557 [Hibiscus sabdariffa]|uniref:Uncharacterized protein n=1 Tax=Hibiscus sabdariffa TaxID=183260 RepID=A0ABR2DY16_9ROSI